MAATKDKIENTEAKKKVKGVSTKELADRLEIEPRQLRYFLREHDLGVGRGKRYDFTEKQARKIEELYEEWSEEE